ncbi:MAG: hypothetical protein AABX28_02415 [Nanoarchaeota archaeon]
MEEKYASVLIDELSKHSVIKPINRDLFTGILIKTEMPESSRFYEELPLNSQLLNERTRYYEFSLRRVLRNKNAGRDETWALKDLWNGFLLGNTYSSTALARDIRKNPRLVEIMLKSSCPYSLLGKLETSDCVETSDCDNPKEIPKRTLFRKTKPVLIIPDADNIDLIEMANWGEIHAVYEEEVGIFFRDFKRINPSEYLLQDREYLEDN